MRGITPCIFWPWTQLDGDLCRTCTENYLGQHSSLSPDDHLEHNFDELLLVLLPELPQDQHTKVLPGWVLLKEGVCPAIFLSSVNNEIGKSWQPGWEEIGQVIESLTLKYISPFFSTSFVISTSSCNQKVEEKEQNIFSYWDIKLVEILDFGTSAFPFSGSWSCGHLPSTKRMHQTLAQLSLINNTTQVYNISSITFLDFSSFLSDSNLGNLRRKIVLCTPKFVRWDGVCCARFRDQILISSENWSVWGKNN